MGDAWIGYLSGKFKPGLIAFGKRVNGKIHGLSLTVMDAPKMTVFSVGEQLELDARPIDNFYDKFLPAVVNRQDTEKVKNEPFVLMESGVRAYSVESSTYWQIEYMVAQTEYYKCVDASLLKCRFVRIRINVMEIGQVSIFRGLKLFRKLIQTVTGVIYG